MTSHSSTGRHGHGAVSSSSSESSSPDPEAKQDTPSTEQKSDSPPGEQQSSPLAQPQRAAVQRFALAPTGKGTFALSHTPQFTRTRARADALRHTQALVPTRSSTPLAAIQEHQRAATPIVKLNPVTMLTSTARKGDSSPLSHSARSLKGEYSVLSDKLGQSSDTHEALVHTGTHSLFDESPGDMTNFLDNMSEVEVGTHSGTTPPSAAQVKPKTDSHSSPRTRTRTVLHGTGSDFHSGTHSPTHVTNTSMSGSTEPAPRAPITPVATHDIRTTTLTHATTPKAQPTALTTAQTHVGTNQKPAQQPTSQDVRAAPYAHHVPRAQRENKLDTPSTGAMNWYSQSFAMNPRAMSLPPDSGGCSAAFAPTNLQHSAISPIGHTCTGRTFNSTASHTSTYTNPPTPAARSSAHSSSHQSASAVATTHTHNASSVPTQHAYAPPVPLAHTNASQPQRATRKHNTSPLSTAGIQTDAAVNALVKAIQNIDHGRKHALQKFSGTAMENVDARGSRAYALASELKWDSNKLYREGFLALDGSAYSEWENNREELERTRSFDLLLATLRRRFLPSNEPEQAIDTFLGFAQTSVESAAAFISRYQAALTRARRYGFSDPVVAFRIFIRSVHGRFAQDVARMAPKNLGQAFEALRKAEEIYMLPPSVGNTHVNLIKTPVAQESVYVRHEDAVPSTYRPETTTQAVTALIRAAEANTTAIKQSMNEMVSQCRDTIHAALEQSGTAKQRPFSMNVSKFCTFCSKPNHTFENCYTRKTLEHIEREPFATQKAPSGTARRKFFCTFCGKTNHNISHCFLAARQHAQAQARATQTHPKKHAPPPDASSWNPRAQAQKFYPPRHVTGRGNARINAITSRNRTPVFKTPVRVGYVQTMLLWDSGAEASVVDAQFVQKLIGLHLVSGPSPRQPLGPNPRIHGADQTAMQSSTAVDIQFTVQNAEFFETFVIVENLGVPPIVSSDYMLMHKVQIDYDCFHLRIPERNIDIPVSIEFRSSEDDQKFKSLLFPLEAVRIAPHDHVTITLTHDGNDPHVHQTRSVYVDNRPHNVATRYLRISPAVYNAENGKVTNVCVTNFSNGPLFLDPQTAIADAFPITSEVVGEERPVCTVDTPLNYFFEPSNGGEHFEAHMPVDQSAPWVTQKAEKFSKFWNPDHEVLAHDTDLHCAPQHLYEMTEHARTENAIPAHTSTLALGPTGDSNFGDSDLTHVTACAPDSTHNALHRDLHHRSEKHTHALANTLGCDQIPDFQTLAPQSRQQAA